MIYSLSLFQKVLAEYLFIRMTIILKLNTFVKDSTPNQIGTPLFRRASHITQSDRLQTQPQWAWAVVYYVMHCFFLSTTVTNW
jgi:hypothetical protein